MSNEIAVFSSYSSCCEEGRYCSSPRLVTELLLSEKGSIFREAVECYQAVYGQLWVNEITEPTLLKSKELHIIRQARAAQQILYLGAIEWLSGRMSVKLACGFSLGYAAVFMAARSVSPSDWLRYIHPANSRYAKDNLKVWMEGRTFTTLLSCASDKLFYPHLVALLASNFPSVLVKDNRFPYSMQVVGSDNELLALREMLFEAFPKAKDRSTALIRTDSAHLFPESYDEILSAFQSVRFHPPRFEVNTHVDALPAGQPMHEGGAVLFRAVQARLSMGVINNRVTKSGLPLVLVGSERAAKFAFYGFGSALFQSPYFFWEDILSGVDTPARFTLLQDAPAW